LTYNQHHDELQNIAKVKSKIESSGKVCENQPEQVRQTY